ncbi:receptor-type tyrosine-protein phosphatase N2 isoform X3 [Ostrinia furnacalis]|uniref:receptor-type tyrosine-protein phosphatase N2 isoform X3 n=1 Tax=Ostrinia furnacalis TaxID=93504 RepID=UPI00103A0779|nr:receptor-type tyrosine-protein phosphatase N2 isoform X3 [Ostrinia furnacalis]
MDEPGIDTAECAGPRSESTAGVRRNRLNLSFSACFEASSAPVYLEYGLRTATALNDVMCRLRWRPALWALALLSSLAPSHADGNIGCLFSATLCVDGVEWCYDDFAFGRCIQIYEEPDEGALYKYDMSSGQLQWFEGELQRLASRGYRWEHAYTQCVLQAMLYTLRQNLDPSIVNTKICEHFVDPKLSSENIGDGEDDTEVEPDETAFVRFTPNSQIADSDYANEVYNPPLTPDEDPIAYLMAKENEDELNNDENPSDKLRDLMMMSTQEEESPVILPFEGFRERIQAEKAKAHDSDNTVPNVMIDKDKKSLPKAEKDNEVASFSDEERLGAHFRKIKTKPPPYTAEYITGNRFSPLDAEIRSNALEKYKQSFAEKNFPFEYEAVEMPEQRIYNDEDGLDEIPFDAGSGELDPYHSKDGPIGLDGKPSKNMEYLMNYWREIINSKLKPQGALYAEGGPLKADDVQGDTPKFYSEEIQDFFNNEWGFKRRERDDVKKPGPRLDAKTLKILYHNKSVTAHGPADAQKSPHGHDHDHNDYDYDPSYAYVLFQDRFLTDWEKGISFISRLEEMLGLEKNTFTNPRVDRGEVTFKVEKNNKGYNAVDVARRVDDIKEDLRRETGAQVLSTGVGDRSKRPVIRHIESPETLFFGLELPVLLALVGSLAVLIVGAVIFAVLLKRDFNSKRKMQGLSSAAEIDAEAKMDYQVTIEELCRARMSGKWTGQQATAAAPHPTEPPQRITSLSREPDANSPSTRSSTSSWSEEPALTNMDISTGHMVLAYMEDHLRNKDRLEQEWRALCAYEAEPCATVAALKQDNTGKNRYADVLPYDHSRVTLNTLSNHLGSDYINASTIQTDHDPRNPAYIAAAGPLAHTAPDFWQMVWEQGSVVMVMLTRLTENGQQLCHRYWPEEGSELYHIYEVHLVSEHIWCDDYLVRSFYLKNQRTGETRTVTQFHFLSWPENGVPSSTKALLEFRRKVNKSYRGRSCPIVVHCSDGAGRTGTYCLIDMVLNRMAKGAKEIDIAATLEHIRDQRPRTVATKQQFEFVLMAVAEEVHAILKALPAHLQQLQEKKEKEKEKEKETNDKEKPNN